MEQYIPKSALVAEIKKRRKEWWFGSSIEAKYKKEECDDILSLIDILQEEPISEGLEEAADSYIKTHGEILGFGKQTFKAGAKWQKDKMIQNTIDAHCFGFQGAALFSFRLPADNYLVGSEVKVIVIKEE